MFLSKAMHANKQLFNLFLIVLLSINVKVVAQNSNPAFYKEIQLVHKPYTLHTLTREIQKQSGISFSYNASRINPNQKIRIKEGKLTVAVLLATIQKKSGVGYKAIRSNHIIYTEAPSKKGVLAKKKNRRRKTDNIAKANPSESLNKVAVARKKDTASQHIVIIGDSSVASYYFSGAGNVGGSYTGKNITPQKFDFVIDHPDNEWNADPYSRLDHEGRDWQASGPLGFIKDHAVIGVGISADEVYYFNPTITGGFNFLYTTLSYNIGSYPHWRYGLGTSFNLGDRWKMHVTINTGSTVSANYNLSFTDTIIIPPDTIAGITQRNEPLAVQSKLSRFTLSAEWGVRKNLFLSGGVTLNYLKTNYSSNGNAVSINGLDPEEMDGDNKYRTIKPPYLSSNTYSGDQSSNVKTWIGVQLSLIYRLSFR